MLSHHELLEKNMVNAVGGGCGIRVVLVEGSKESNRKVDFGRTLVRSLAGNNSRLDANHYVHHHVQLIAYTSAQA